MRTKIHCAAVLALAVLVCAFKAAAATTIDTTNRYAYAANVGWLDGVADTNNGAVIGEYVCSGYLYAANVGWISLGNGAPTNQIQYLNDSSANFGVNQDGLGNLTGYAYGANIGWINFEQTYGKPRVDLLTGHLGGSVWSANCGWISLSNSVAYVQTDAIRQGTLAPDGLPVAWLLQNFGTTNINANADPDGDGQSNQQEYLAGTDPNSAASAFLITYIAHGQPTTAFTTLVWNSLPTRFYVVQERPSLTATNWADYINAPLAGLGSIGFSDFNNTNEFFRVRAYRPLTP